MRNTLNSKFRHILANQSSYKQPAETNTENMEFGCSLSKTQLFCTILGI